MVFYHTTSKQNLENILREGLTPMIGENSKLVGEQEKAVFLTDSKSLPYWQIILNQPVTLRISGLNESDVNIFSYGNYKEYMYNRIIPAENIKIVKRKRHDIEAMKKLCKSYMYSLSDFSKNCARYYEKMDDNDMLNDLVMQSASLLKVLYNLDFNSLSVAEKKKILKDMGKSGLYTICDQYYDTGKRLYQMLKDYPKDALTENRIKVYNYIKANFKYCLSINTGGWCG